MVLDNQGNYESQSVAIAPKIGCGRDARRRWVAAAWLRGVI
jgi:hypothetical protein